MLIILILVWNNACSVLFQDNSGPQSGCQDLSGWKINKFLIENNI